MSDEQQQPDQQVQVAPPEQPKHAWGAPLDSIPSVRQDKLRALADRQRKWAAQVAPDLKQSVFNDVHLTGVEVFFLAAYALAVQEGTHDDVEQAAEKLRGPDRFILALYMLHLEGANLSGATLNGAYLSGAYLSGATLSGASLIRATLSGATLSGATLTGASLYRATLTGASLYRATLTGAFLIRATL